MQVNSTLYYTLKDHPSASLRTSPGSASVITDTSGNIVGEQRYYPYGETRITSGTIYTDKLFTGQREMTGLGIYHYQARFYSPRLGRFLSADTIVPGMSNPQAFNRYSYVVGNPMRYNDPTGHVCSDPEDPTPSCESGNPYPNNTTPLPAGPQAPGGPLDPGLPQNKPSGGGGGNNGGGGSENTENDWLNWLLDMFNSYNYYAGTDDISLYQLYTWMYDVEITGRFGLIYANNSPLTIHLFPPALRNAFYQTNDGFSAYGGTEPSLGYAQSLPHSVISTVSGINVNPITGGFTSSLSIGGKSLMYRQSVTVRATVRPMETTLATIGGGMALAYFFFGPAGAAAGGEIFRQLAPAFK